MAEGTTENQTVQYRPERVMGKLLGGVARAVDADLINRKNALVLVARQQAVVDQKVSKAPFSERLGLRCVDERQYSSAGTTFVIVKRLTLSGFPGPIGMNLRCLVCAMAIGMFFGMAEVTLGHAQVSEEIENSLDPSTNLKMQIARTSRDCASGFGAPVWKDPAEGPIGVVCVPSTPDGD